MKEVEFMLDAVVQNEGEPDIVQISGGLFHTCALTSGGDVYCWGRGQSIGVGVRDLCAADDEADAVNGSCAAVAFVSDGNLPVTYTALEKMMGGPVGPLGRCRICIVIDMLEDAARSLRR